MTTPDSIAINGWVALLTPVGIALLTVINIISARMGTARGVQAVKAAHNAETATKEAKEAAIVAKNTLALTTATQSKQLSDIHKLVNSEYAVSLRVGATALERVAAITKDPEDLAQAKIARQMSVDHDRKQRVLDETTVAGIADLQKRSDLEDRAALEREAHKKDKEETKT